MPISKSKRATVFDKTSGKCAYCGCKITLISMTVDHVNPRCNGGGNSIENLLPACKSCNSSKGQGSIEWLRIRSKFISKFERKISKDVIDFCIENGFMEQLNLPDHKFYFEVM